MLVIIIKLNEKGKKIQKKVFKENSPALTLRGKIELKRRKPLK